MAFIIKNDDFLEFIGCQDDFFRIESAVFENRSGHNTYKINSMRDLIYVANKIDEITGDNFTFNLTNKDTSKKSFQVRDALSLKEYVNIHLKDSKNMTFAEKKSLKIKSRINKLRMEPTPDLSVPHNGTCGHCRNSVEADQAHCIHCGAFWGLPANDVRLRDEYISGFYVISTIIFLLVLVFF